VTLSAPEYKGSKFKAWSGCEAEVEGKCIVTMSSAKSVSAEFVAVPKHPLTLSKEGTGQGAVKSSPASINCSNACTIQTSSFYEETMVEGKYLPTVVTLTETPAANSSFTEWSAGPCKGSKEATCKVPMSEAKAAVAAFALVGKAPAPSKALTLTKEGTGAGKVGSYPGGIACDANCSSQTASLKEGALITLKATPSKNSAFTKWTGCEAEVEGACQVTLSSAKEVKASFSLIPTKTLTLNKSGGGTGTVKSKPAGVNCGLTCPTTTAFYSEGTSVDLSATPGKGSGAAVWSGCDEVTGEGHCIVKATFDRTVVAKFE
jgi:hypothetical protein